MTIIRHGQEPVPPALDTCPVGATFLWRSPGGLGLPHWFLPCDGRAVSRDTYAELHELAADTGYHWGHGDGLTTFNVPSIPCDEPGAFVIIRALPMGTHVGVEVEG